MGKDSNLRNDEDRSPDFKSGALDHSATHPNLIIINKKIKIKFLKKRKTTLNIKKKDDKRKRS